LKKSKKQ